MSAYQFTIPLDREGNDPLGVEWQDCRSQMALEHLLRRNDISIVFKTRAPWLAADKRHDLAPANDHIVGSVYELTFDEEAYALVGKFAPVGVYGNLCNRHAEMMVGLWMEAYTADKTRVCNAIISIIIGLRDEKAFPEARGRFSPLLET